MKRKSTLLFILSLLLFNLSTFAREKVISESKLPFTIREYIATYFKDARIIKCEKEIKGSGDVVSTQARSLRF